MAWPSRTPGAWRLWQRGRAATRADDHLLEGRLSRSFLRGGRQGSEQYGRGTGDAMTAAQVRRFAKHDLGCPWRARSVPKPRWFPKHPRRGRLGQTAVGTVDCALDRREAHR